MADDPKAEDKKWDFMERVPTPVILRELNRRELDDEHRSINLEMVTTADLITELTGRTNIEFIIAVEYKDDTELDDELKLVSDRLIMCYGRWGTFGDARQMIGALTEYITEATDE